VRYRKIALLKTEARACVQGLANVLFCGLDFQFIFAFCSKAFTVNEFSKLVHNA